MAKHRDVTQECTDFCKTMPKLSGVGSDSAEMHEVLQLEYVLHTAQHGCCKLCKNTYIPPEHMQSTPKQSQYLLHQTRDTYISLNSAVRPL